MTIPVTDSSEASSKFAREAWIRALERTASIGRDGVTLPVLIDRLARKFDAAPALVSAEAALSYRDLASRCNQYARWGLAQGLEPGDTVCLMMANCAQYLAIWLGLTRIGAVVALINNNLAGDALVHSISIVAPRTVIAGSEAESRLDAVRTRLGAGLRSWVYGQGTQGLAPLEPELAGFCGDELRDSECAPPPIDSTALYIYTSGTTGLPKAAKVSHYRVMQWSHWFAGLMDTQTDGSHVQLPAAVPQRGGRGRDRGHAGGRGSGGDSCALLGFGLLARRARGALHLVPVHRRTVPLPSQRAAHGQ